MFIGNTQRGFYCPLLSLRRNCRNSGKPCNFLSLGDPKNLDENIEENIEKCLKVLKALELKIKNDQRLKLKQSIKKLEEIKKLEVEK
ncbi:MAG TPA: hypothetical protein PL164_02135 [Candidatus Paceibacterota bacterium]|nr:hypothetical protein [Candidatus Paceibacterota bacterium]HPP64953.1 hypothetical protein [Candidatus Paceibacterota bacterium]